MTLEYLNTTWRDGDYWARAMSHGFYIERISYHKGAWCTQDYGWNSTVYKNKSNIILLDDSPRDMYRMPLFYNWEIFKKQKIKKIDISEYEIIDETMELRKTKN